MASVGNNTSSAATKGEDNDKGSTPVSPSISSDHGKLGVSLFKSKHVWMASLDCPHKATQHSTSG
ncbi:hypothetical protein F4775DRAFT_534411 [Biscogniauxia sp. FL1348]|nr:hypothetical protein F4775DRAFT_534411 [Biscogniauxia sp. FL1348]